MGDALKKYLSRVDKAGRLEEAAIAQHWGDVVGSDIGQHTIVRGLRDGELLVAVDSSVWATELSAMSEELKERLNAKTGKNSVRSMKFTPSKIVEDSREEARIHGDAARRYGGEKVKAEPLTDEEMAAVERSVASIEDPKLREVALRATVRDLEWKKGIEASKRR